jgi:hypothetical protein
MTSEGSQDWRSPVADQRSPGQCSEFLPKRRLGGLGTSKRALQVRRGHIPCLSGVHPARERVVTSWTSHVLLSGSVK